MEISALGKYNNLKTKWESHYFVQHIGYEGDLIEIQTDADTEGHELMYMILDFNKHGFYCIDSNLDYDIQDEDGGDEFITVNQFAFKPI